MLYSEATLTDLEYQLIDQVQLYNLEYHKWKLKTTLSQLKVRQAIKQLKVVTDGHVQCCYCGEFLKLPYIYVVNESANQFVGAFDFNLNNIKDIKTPYNYSTKIHPHISGNRICMGTFVGKENGAIDAITLGLNPDSPYCNIPDWLASLGHFCEKMGNPCPTHGHTCAEIPPLVDEAAGTITEQRFRCQKIVKHFIDKDCPICESCNPFYLNGFMGHCENERWGKGVVFFDGAFFNKSFSIEDYTKCLRGYDNLDLLEAITNNIRYELIGRTFDVNDSDQMESFAAYLEKRVI